MCNFLGEIRIKNREMYWTEKFKNSPSLLKKPKTKDWIGENPAQTAQGNKTKNRRIEYENRKTELKIGEIRKTETPPSTSSNQRL